MATKLLGKTEPRLFTASLRKLTRRTSLGYDILDWAEKELKWKPLPWQKWVIIHANELLPGGKLRFRKILFLAARQNGKSALVTVMSLYWMTHANPKVLYSSASLDTARDQWETAMDYAEDNPNEFGPVKPTRMNGHWSMRLPKFKASYEVISANRRGGRGKFSINRAIVDELREHMDFDAMGAVESTMLTVEDAQLWMLSNAGDRRSVVLNHYRALGQSGDDPELFYAEYSAPEDCELDDRDAWAQANPGLGYTITERALAGLMTGTASVFRTENLCIGVDALNEAIAPAGWKNCFDAGTLDAHRSRVAVCFDMSPDMKHAVLVAAAMLPDGRTRVETVAAWESTAEVRNELPALLDRIKPRTIGWFSTGPAAAISTDLKKLSRNVELTGSEVTAVCQELAELVSAARVAHNGDEMLTAHVLGTRKAKVSDGWKFVRSESEWIDGAYAVAGAVHLARKIPPPSKMRVVVAPSDR